MVKIVLKPKYKALAKKNVVLDVKPGRKIRMRRPRMGIKKLANKVALLNSERKDTGWISSTELPVGQVIGLTGGIVSSGHYTTSLTPLPSQGDAGNQRTGDKITITGIYNQFQFTQQSNGLAPCRGKIIFAVPKFSSYSSVVSGASAQGIETLLYANPIIGAQSGVSVYDSLCARNQDYIADWKILRTVNFKVGGDTVSGMKTVKTVRAGLRFKKPHQVHFAPATNSVISGDIRVFILFECGNAGVALANTTTGLNTNAQGIPIKDASSGYTMCFMSKAYYLDE